MSEFTRILFRNQIISIQGIRKVFSSFCAKVTYKKCLTGNHHNKCCTHIHSSMKPPNILIQTDVQDRSSKWKELLALVLSEDVYTIYQLPSSKVANTPWLYNCALLILDTTSSIFKENTNMITEYLGQGGKVLSFVPRMYMTSSDVKSELCAIKWNKDNEMTEDTVETLVNDWKEGGLDASRLHLCVGGQEILINEVKTQNNVVWSEQNKSIVFSRADILPMHFPNNDPEAGTCKGSIADLWLLRRILLHLAIQSKSVQELKQQEPDHHKLLTHAVMLGDEKYVKQCLSECQKVMEDNIISGPQLSLKFIKGQDLSGSTASNTLLPILVGGQCKSFNYDVYCSNLETQDLGKVIVYSDVLTSTQDVFQNNYKFAMHAPHGTVVAGRQQVKGQGRGGNSWLSPVGCMMFSINLVIPVQSQLGQRLPYLQQIAPVAVALAVRGLAGYEDIPITIKWPNDIYSGKSTKIGGVLVKTTMYKDEFRAVLGLGVNLANEKPTVCINHMIHEYNVQHKTNLAPLTYECLLGRTLLWLESLIDMFQREGVAAFCAILYRHWIHGGQKVRVESENNEEITICGLDDYGFLQGKTKHGKVITLQPDGNTFDMMHNLIRLK